MFVAAAAYNQLLYFIVYKIYFLLVHVMQNIQTGTSIRSKTHLEPIGSITLEVVSYHMYTRGWLVVELMYTLIPSIVNF